MKRRCRGLTLLEILAASALLLVVLAAVGAIFKSASQAVGTSESVVEMTSSARSIERQMALDIGSMNRGGFLIIRSRVDDTTGQRYDQLSFLATGAFHDVSGVARAHAAHIWWGQLAVHDDVSAADQGVALPQGELPTGPLGRHATLLMASDAAGATAVSFGGQKLACFSDIRYGTGAVSAGLGESAADITSSRLSLASVTPSQIVAAIRSAGADNGGDLVDRYCYRFKTLSSVYGSQVSMVNGYSRMTPIALQKVTSFGVEWASSFDSSGSTVWYGLGGQGKKSSEDPDYADNEPTPADGSGDGYVAVFGVDTPRERWPTALRITMKVNDPAGRLVGGRTFVDVVKVPE